MKKSGMSELRKKITATSTSDHQPNYLRATKTSTSKSKVVQKREDHKMTTVVQKREGHKMTTVVQKREDHKMTTVKNKKKKENMIIYLAVLALQPSGVTDTLWYAIDLSSVALPRRQTKTKIKLSPLFKLPNSHISYGCAALDSKLYVFGGFDQCCRTAINRALVYDTAGKWTELTPMLSPKLSPTVYPTADGGLYVQTNNNPLARDDNGRLVRDENGDNVPSYVMFAETYYPSSGTWTPHYSVTGGCSTRPHPPVVVEGVEYTLFNGLIYAKDLKTRQRSAVTGLEDAFSCAPDSEYSGTFLFHTGEDRNFCLVWSPNFDLPYDNEKIKIHCLKFHFLPCNGSEDISQHPPAAVIDGHSRYTADGYYLHHCLGMPM